MADFTLPQAKKAAGLTPTDIEWTDLAFNPLRAVTREGKAGWACVKVAPGCAHCYAESLNKRWGTGLPFTPAGMRDVRVVLDEARVAAALTAKLRGPFRAPDGRPKVFVCDMTDLFGEWVPFDVIDRIFALFALRQDIDWQILTKRPERMAEYLRRGPGWVKDACLLQFGEECVFPWPLRNLWLGCSAATQKDLDENVPHLARCPASVRFLSLEPLVEAVELADWLPWGPHDEAAKLDWVIVGGESGPRARSCDVDWILSVVRQCREADVPCFVKQLGSRPVVEPRWDSTGTLVAPTCFLQLVDAKGGDPSEWPAGLSVRQWPVRKEADRG